MPAKPFAQGVWLPSPGQWVVTPWYQYTEFQNAWRGSRYEDFSVPDRHGFDQNDGIVLIEYGISRGWAGDVTVGYTDLATRAFTTPYGTVQKTAGARDVTFGARWQVLTETNATSRWTPTLTLRAGGFYRGTYKATFPYAPGNASVGVEPSMLLDKQLGWEGFGLYADSGFRNVRSGGTSQFFTGIGLTKRHKQFAFNAGFRHQANVGGVDVGGTGNTIVYSEKVRERNELFESGFNYRFKNDVVFQFYYGMNVAGRNTGDKDIYGISLSFPFQTGHRE
jgi:hypothetical protein